MLLLHKRSGPRLVSDSLLFQTQVKVSSFCQTIMPQILVPSPPGVVSDCSGENTYQLIMLQTQVTSHMERSLAITSDHYITDACTKPTCLSPADWSPSSCSPAITHSTSWASRVTKECRLPSTLGRCRIFLVGLAPMPIMKGLAVVRDEKSTVSTITGHSSSKYSSVAASCDNSTQAGDQSATFPLMPQSL